MSLENSLSTEFEQREYTLTTHTCIIVPWLLSLPVN